MNRSMRRKLTATGRKSIQNRLDTSKPKSLTPHHMKLEHPDGKVYEVLTDQNGYYLNNTITSTTPAVEPSDLAKVKELGGVGPIVPGKFYFISNSSDNLNIPDDMSMVVGFFTPEQLKGVGEQVVTGEIIKNGGGSASKKTNKATVSSDNSKS